MEIKIVIDDRILKFLARKRVLASLVVVAALGAVSTDAAPTFMVPNNFTSGTVISSSQMNQNFAAISNVLNSHEGRISNLEASPAVTELLFPNSPGGPVMVPPNAHSVEIEALGAGGGGGGVDTGNADGADGGFGDHIKAVVTVTPGSPLTVSVGTGGSAGNIDQTNSCLSGSSAATAGQRGGDTIISGTDGAGNPFKVTAGGGAGGDAFLNIGCTGTLSAGADGTGATVGAVSSVELPVGGVGPGEGGYGGTAVYSGAYTYFPGTSGGNGLAILKFF